MTPESDPRLQEGIDLFNAGKHWHAHEAWEGIWIDSKDDDRRFIQGLIMAAALLVHHARGNPAGVARHWANVQDRLPDFAPARWGIDVAGLLRQLTEFARDASTGAMQLDPKTVHIQTASPTARR
jgi:hypothetical protein